MSAASTPITIPSWANGPEGSGNGGWSAGLLAERLGPEALMRGATVNLRVPPPIGRPLEVTATDDGRLQLLDGETVVADAEATDTVWVDFTASLGPLDVDRARAARGGFPFRDRHPFPGCVCCGTTRAAGLPFLDLHCGPVDGLRIPTDQTGLTQVYADAWTPGAEFADPDDPKHVSVPATWSALDCPSATPIADPDAARPSVLARIAAVLRKRPRVGATYTVCAWLQSVDGRKQFTASAIIDPATRSPIAQAEALWIEVRTR